jgi:hypothetical protein
LTLNKASMSEQQLIESFVQRAGDTAERTLLCEKLASLDQKLAQCRPEPAEHEKFWLCQLAELRCEQLAARIAYLDSAARISDETLAVFLEGVSEFRFAQDDFAAWLSKWQSQAVGSAADHHQKLMQAMSDELDLPFVLESPLAAVSAPAQQPLVSEPEPQPVVSEPEPQPVVSEPQPVVSEPQPVVSEPQAETLAIVPFVPRPEPEQPAVPEIIPVSDVSQLLQDVTMKDFFKQFFQVGPTPTLSQLQNLVAKCQGPELAVSVSDYSTEAGSKAAGFDLSQIRIESSKCPSQSPYWRVRLHIDAAPGSQLAAQLPQGSAEKEFMASDEQLAALHQHTEQLSTALPGQLSTYVDALNQASTAFQKQ